MKQILIIDTGYLDELYQVPGKSSPDGHQRVKEKFAEAVQNNALRFVPYTCILELGNHIARVNNGSKRRELALRLASDVRLTVSTNAGDATDRPWTITPASKIEVLPDICDRFAQHHVSHKVGLVDAFVLEETERLRSIYQSQGYRIHIWTTDSALKAQEPDQEPNPFPG